MVARRLQGGACAGEICEEKTQTLKCCLSRAHTLPPFACLNFEFRQRSLKGLREPLHPPTHHYRQKCKGCFGSKKPFGQSSSHSPKVPKSFSEPLDPLHLIINKNVRGILVLRNLSGSDAQGARVPPNLRHARTLDGGVRLARTLGARARSIPATWGLVTCNL